jgi:uncharacterized membrane protein YcaP (DUF421 family)
VTYAKIFFQNGVIPFFYLCLRTRTYIIKRQELTSREWILQKCKFSRKALDQGLRAKDIFNIEEVAQALLEVVGTLSVLKKKDYRSLTLKELKTLFSERRIH